jgi:ElaB/YqjD/DUF883 family membrane-anchored ribosome-binding protein
MAGVREVRGDAEELARAASLERGRGIGNAARKRPGVSAARLREVANASYICPCRSRAFLIEPRRRYTENTMETTAKLETGKSRIQDASDRAQDYLDRATNTTSSGVDKITDTARRSVDSAAESARAGLDWAADKASALRDRNSALMNAVTDTVSSRPMVAIGIAAAIGYQLGRIMRSND